MTNHHAPESTQCRATAELVDRRDGSSMGWTLTCFLPSGHAGEHRASIRWDGPEPDADLADPDEDFDVELDALPHEEAVERARAVAGFWPSDGACGADSHPLGGPCTFPRGHSGVHSS